MINNLCYNILLFLIINKFKIKVKTKHLIIEKIYKLN